MLEEARIVADGGEPKAIIRDPEKNHQLYLPRQGRNRTGPVFGARTDGKAPRTGLLAKQPQAVLDEMDKIWAEHGSKATTV